MTQVHGHRGCADGVPPNTIPAFLRAAATRCHWVEMDVVCTGDRQLLVSHEPWMDHATCVDPEGRSFSEAHGRSLNLYKMPLAEIQRYGVRPEGGDGVPHPKPTLAGVVAALRQWSLGTDAPMPGFNIEVKSDPAWYGMYQPPPGDLAQAVLEEMDAQQITEQSLVQCFDPAVLEALHERNAGLPLALLVDNLGGVQDNLERLGFTPAYYSVPFFLVTAALVAELRERGIALLTWTVNGRADMQRMIGLGVDGLITDRPGEAMELLHAY